MSRFGGVPISCGDLPIICRDVADAPDYGRVNANEHEPVGGTMADVSGFGRMRPDGAKIVELRKRCGLKQEVLAEKANISVRQLGEIERKSKTVHATTITAIATVLGATPREITLSDPDEAPGKFQTLLKLEGSQSATDLSWLAKFADSHGYLLKVDPSVEAAAEMQEVMKIVGYYVTGEPDEFEKMPFGDIPRLARLHQLLEKLRAGVWPSFAPSLREASNSATSEATVTSARSAPRSLISSIRHRTSSIFINRVELRGSE